MEKKNSFNYVECQEIVFIIFECLMCVILGPFFQEPLLQSIFNF
jgi:hypothetical protein